MNKLILWIFLLCCPLLWSQDRKLLNGKVTSEMSDLEGIYVTNLQTDITIATQPGGYFSIYARENDSLRFSAVQFYEKTIVLTATDFGKELLFVPIEPSVTHIEAVEVEKYKSISAESLGIIPKGQKRYTPAERRLQTATGYMGIGPGASLDGLLNWMSGRTTMLKKELQVERKQTLLQKVEYMFEVEFFTEKLHIPENHVNGFCYYIVENAKFASAVNSKNRTMATFLIGELATEYLKLIANEK